MKAIKPLFNWLRRPSSRFSIGAILIVGTIIGALLTTSFNAYVSYTNSMEFCISCHEMRDTVYQEYKKSSHYQNASGVRAICSDCHVPKGEIEKLVRKVQATKELYHKLMGTIDTKEKFEAKRLELAEKVWESMRSTDSIECRNCHSFEAMAVHKQSRRAQEKMDISERNGKTCIDCHKGVAHKNPEEDEDD